MERIAFKMKLYNGCGAEYKRRHHIIWPELVDLLKQAGISEYFIFMDEETDILFATLKVHDAKQLDELPAKEIMKKWWAYMSDIMESNADSSPVSTPLKKLFYMP